MAYQVKTIGSNKSKKEIRQEKALSRRESDFEDYSKMLSGVLGFTEDVPNEEIAKRKKEKAFQDIKNLRGKLGHE